MCWAEKRHANRFAGHATHKQAAGSAPRVRSRNCLFLHVSKGTKNLCGVTLPITKSARTHVCFSPGLNETMNDSTPHRDSARNLSSPKSYSVLSSAEIEPQQPREIKKSEA